MGYGSKKVECSTERIIMKTKLVLWGLVITTMFLTSCAGGVKGIFGKSSSQESKQASAVDDVRKHETKNLSVKMEQVAVLAAGTDYALQKVTNTEPAIDVAEDINKRVMSLAGRPNLDAEKEMWNTIDQLTSQLASERAKGIKAIERKDLLIGVLQDETKVLSAAKDIEIDKYMKLSKSNALLADTRKAQLDDYQGWFGLKAVFLGFSQFIKTAMWFVLGGSILFIILRFASMSSPLAASIFSIIERIASWGINTITVLAPKALEKAGAVSKVLYDKTNILLKKIIDNIENIKQIEEVTGKSITLKQLLDELSKSMNDDEKLQIDVIRKKLGY